MFTDCPTSWTINTSTGTTSATVLWSPPEVVDDNQLDADNVEVDIEPAPPGVVLEDDEDVEVTLERGVYKVTYSYVDVNQQEGLCVFQITVAGNYCPFHIFVL